MKRKYVILLIALLTLVIFVIGAPTGKAILRLCTQDANLSTWTAEFRRLDAIFPRTEANERTRLEMARRLARRGIYVDDGIRDEAVEDSLTVPNIVRQICWGWAELLN